MAFLQEHPLTTTASESHLVTYSGILYPVFRPRVEHVWIVDIAHSLSHQCRYGGHSDFFYSVAEHSVLVSDLLPRALALEGLLHDAAEAYCQDLSAPMKQWLPDYLALLATNETVVRRAFSLPITETPLVKTVDVLVGYHERTRITKHHRGPVDRFKSSAAGCAETRQLWDGLLSQAREYTAADRRRLRGRGLPLIACLDPEDAKSLFLKRFQTLTTY